MKPSRLTRPKMDELRVLIRTHPGALADALKESLAEVNSLSRDLNSALAAEIRLAQALVKIESLPVIPTCSDCGFSTTIMCAHPRMIAAKEANMHSAPPDWCPMRGVK